MKNRINLIILAFLASLLIVSQLSACSLVNRVSSTPTTYWNEDSSGTIQTNDIARLQKMFPFTIILPEYLPDGLNSYNLVMTVHKIDQAVDLQIIYYYLKDAREIQIFESPPLDTYPRPLPPGLFAKMNPDYTPIELGGIEVLEENGFGEVIWSGQNTRVSSFQYLWERNDLHYSINILGCNQSESRKIIESMIR